MFILWSVVQKQTVRSLHVHWLKKCYCDVIQKREESEVTMEICEQGSSQQQGRAIETLYPGNIREVV